MNPSITLKIPERASTSCPIWIEEGLLQTSMQWMDEYLKNNECVIITDDHVKPLYAEKLQETLKEAGRNPLLISFPPGESSKTYITQQFVEEQMFKQGYQRDTLMIALGGGVVGDLAGFVAATYMRGLPYIQIPTSLLAMVDSSVGGKTGIDTPYGKNLIGAFWQPKAVIADMNCLDTLPHSHLINGFFEILKIFLTHDAQHFEYATHHLNLLLQRDKRYLKKIITRAVQIKAHIVEEDEKEQNQRALLNLGHTIGHALEKISRYKLLHGFAVGLGLLVEAKIAQKLGILPSESFNQIKNTLNKLGIHGNDLKEFDVLQIIQATRHDKKVKAKKAHYVLLEDVGKAYVKNQEFTHYVPEETIQEAFFEVCYDDAHT